MRTFVVGNENCVLGFSLVGVPGQVVKDQAELDKALSTYMADKTIGLLLITSDVAQWARARVDALKVNSIAPLLVEIPGEGEQAAAPSLKEFVQRAVGLNLGGN
jgi:V/A-type H+/Na+-transporting ATPase subunit F